MSLETGRNAAEQELFERVLIHDLESAQSDTNNWRNKAAPLIYRERFVDAMIRIQVGDVRSVFLSFETDPAGNEMASLRLPVVTPTWRNWEKILELRLSNLERYEPNIRDLLPASIAS